MWNFEIVQIRTGLNAMQRFDKSVVYLSWRCQTYQYFMTHTTGNLTQFASVFVTILHLTSRVFKLMPKAWPQWKHVCLGCKIYINSTLCRFLLQKVHKIYHILPTKRQTSNHKTNSNQRLEKSVRCIFFFCFLTGNCVFFFDWAPTIDMVITSYFWNSQ